MSENTDGEKEEKNTGESTGEIIGRQLTDFIQATPEGIFEDVKYLKEKYIPEEFPFREDEIQSVIYNWSAFFDGMTPDHTWIYGPPSTGKSHVSRRAVEELNSRAKKLDIPDIRYVYVSCNNKTLPKVYASLLSNIGVDKAPKRGISVDDQMDRLKNKIDGMKVLFVFDEIDKMISTQPYYRPQETLINHFTRITDDDPAHFDAEVSIAVILNNPKVIDDMDASTQSTFSPQKIFFKAYNAVETSKILLKRCRQAFRDDVISDDVVKRFGANIYQSSRDLRTAFKVLRQAGRRVGVNGGDRIKYTHLQDSLDKVEKDIMSDMLSNFDDTQLALTLAVTTAYKNANNGGKGAMSDDVYKHYKKVANNFNLRVLSRRHIMDNVVPRMEVQGIFTKSLHGRGRRQGVSAYFSIDEGDQQQLLEECTKQLKQKCT